MRTLYVGIVLFYKSLTNSVPVSRAAEITDSQFSRLNQHDWAH